MWGMVRAGRPLCSCSGHGWPTTGPESSSISSVTKEAARQPYKTNKMMRKWAAFLRAIHPPYPQNCYCKHGPRV